jgi:hypothetical protein
MPNPPQGNGACLLLQSVWEVYHDLPVAHPLLAAIFSLAVPSTVRVLTTESMAIAEGEIFFIQWFSV